MIGHEQWLEPPEWEQRFIPYCPRCKSHALSGTGRQGKFVIIRCRSCNLFMDMHINELR